MAGEEKQLVAMILSLTAPTLSIAYGINKSSYEYGYKIGRIQFDCSKVEDSFL